MHKRFFSPLLVVLALALAFLAGATFAERTADPLASDVITRTTATPDEADWGTFYTYYAGETYGTMDGLAGVAVIKPGREIHRPHVHAEEEFLMVTEGEGVWHLNGKEFPASAGDMLYAAPWDIHGITNTGSTPLTFVVWKWNNKGVELPTQSTDEGH